MKVNQKLLSNALKTVMPGIGDKGHRYILRTIYLQHIENKLILRATNEEVEISTSIEVEEDAPFAICVDPMLTSVVSAFDEGDIELTMEKRLKVAQGSRVHNISYVPPKDFPEKLQIEGYKKADLTKIVEGLRLASIAYSREEARPILQDYLVYPGEGYLATANGESQFVVFDKVVIPGPGELVPIPAKILEGLLNLVKDLDEPECVFGGTKQDENKAVWIGFRDDTTEILMRKDSGELSQPITNFFDKAENEEAQLTLTIDTKSFNRAIQMCLFYYARALSESKPHHVTLIYDGKEVKLKMDITDLADFEEPLEVTEVVGGKYKINLNPKSLNDIVSVIQSDAFNVKFLQSNEPFLIKDTNIPEFRCLQVPMTQKKGK